LKLLGLLVVMAPVPGCGGSASPQASADAPGPITPDAGASADAGCGLSFDEAVEAYAPERVCQTTVYDLTTGYCTHWVACASLH
jgi:hypothetical protein